MMTVLVILGIVFTIVIALYLMGNARTTQRIHRQSVRAMLFIIRAESHKSPHRPLSDIYLSVVKGRCGRLLGTNEENYLSILAQDGCFDENSQMQPEEFAERAACLEDVIKLKRSGALG